MHSIFRGMHLIGGLCIIFCSAVSFANEFFLLPVLIFGLLWVVLEKDRMAKRAVALGSVYRFQFAAAGVMLVLASVLAFLVSRWFALASLVIGADFVLYYFLHRCACISCIASAFPSVFRKQT